jgi:hypothetical protein
MVENVIVAIVEKVYVPHHEMSGVMKMIFLIMKKIAVESINFIEKMIISKFLCE